MKLLIFILAAFACAGFLIKREKLRQSVEQAVESHEAVVGMTEAQVKQALGEPLLRKRTDTAKGNELVMTYRDGNMVTLKGGTVIKVEQVSVHTALTDLAKSPNPPAHLREAMARPTPAEKPGAWMWKNYKNPLDHPNQNRR